MVKILIGRRRLRRHICSLTYSCPRCGRPFLTEGERAIHLLMCK